MTETVSTILDKAKASDFEAIMVLGLTKSGGMTINSSLNNIALMHWMLNKSIFDINLFERQKPEEKTEKKSQGVDPET
tara:strand:- start:31 stop:264 length:234 start_codon:yes stop_codon:yes gene_type:complete